MCAPPPPPQPSHFNQRIVEADVPTFRAYQVWKGRNRFCLGGRFVFGPDATSLFLTISLILIPVILFCTFVSQWLILEFHHHIGNLIVDICAIFTVYIILLLLFTSGRDPGIIPRNKQPPEDDIEGSIIFSSNWPTSLGGVPNLPPTKDVKVNGVTVKVKYCQTCMIYRPPRCSHCSICSNCVERFDHHCPWVGQCIGKRNYRFFFMFISSTTLLCLYVLTFCVINLGKIMGSYHCSFWTALTMSYASGFLIIYTFISGWFVGGLTGFHIYLILTNQTTYENFRYQYDGKTNPYNRGWAGNIMEIFCSWIPPSRNNFRAKVKMDPSEVLSYSVSYLHSRTPELPGRSLHFEMGRRSAVAAEDLEDIQSQMEYVGRLERCQTQPPHETWDPKDNWKIMRDRRALAAELGMQYGSSPMDLPRTTKAH
ncbi:hypothetical protein SAY87_005394 [Trapa incisa]|uniref:S-acyltransferase n=1 Tax=Trapa incisa TaxID=236973 RepID=A0AAN7Q6B6_9MYRT|nr:hypothetical protein SAY87_005394 [Trapa incisa]